VSSAILAELLPSKFINSDGLRGEYKSEDLFKPNVPFHLETIKRGSDESGMKKGSRRS